MAILSFKVEADVQKVRDLRNEIIQLEATMKRIKKSMPSADISDLEKRLSTAKTEFTSVTIEAAKAGAAIEGGLKQKISAATKEVNNFTEKIIAQKDVIKKVETDVKRLGDAYAKAVRNYSPNAGSLLQDYKSAKVSLEEEKAALFGLNQEKAKAQLNAKRLKEEYKELQDSARGVSDETSALGASIGKWAKGLIGIAAIREFGAQIIRVRGEFQEMETAISTLVGDDMANKIIPQIKELAKVSPLTMSDFVGAEKTMLGFNIEADKTIRYLQAMSDISMGNSQKFNSLTLAFSQMSAAGKLMGQDLNQMINAGFNPLQIISEKTGKSIADLKEQMSKGAISAEMVQQAFIDATEAGGKFYGMSENASKTINGQISMLQDAMDTMFNSIGEKSEGVIIKAIQGVTGVIENYEKVGSILMSLVATYGAYKAAVIAVTAVERTKALTTGLLTNAEKAHYMWLLMVEKAQKLLNKTMLSNPYVLAAMALTGLTTAVVKFLNSSQGAETAVGRVNRQLNELKTKTDELKESIEKHLAVIQDEAASTTQKVKAYNELAKDFPQLTAKYDMQTLSAMSLADATKAVNKEFENQDILLNKQQIRETQARISKLKTDKESFEKSGNDPAVKLRENEIKQEEAVLEELLKRQQEYRDAKKVEQKKEETQDKKYWEKKKAEAESNLNALDVSQKGSKEWNKYVADIARAQKEIDKYSTTSVKDENKDVNEQAEKLKKIQEYKDAAIDAERQAQFEIRQAEINAMKEGTDKTLAQIDLDYDKKIEANKKRTEEFVKALAEQRALEWEVANPDKAKQGEKFDKSKVTEKDLTAEQSKALANYDLVAKKEREQAIIDVYHEEMDAMNSFLKEYGTFQQKKYAIAQEYDRKIANTSSVVEQKKLEAEKGQSLASIDAAALKEEIDWTVVFGELGGMFSAAIQPTLDKVKQFRDSKEFNKLNLNEQQALIQAIKQMEQSLGGAGNFSFKKLGEDVEKYRKAQLTLEDAKERERIAIENLIEKTEEYEKALTSGTESEKVTAEAAKNNAEINASAASENVKTATDAAEQAQENVSKSAKGLSNKMKNIQEGLSKFASGGINNAYQGLIQAGSELEGAIGVVSKKLKDVSIVGWILSIIDLFKDGLSVLVGGILDAIFNAVSGIIKDIFSGQLFVTIFKSIRDGIAKILDTITLGGFSSWTKSSNADEVKETTERLTKRNEILTQSIDALKEEMEKARGAESVKEYQEAIELQKEVIKNTGEILKAQMGYYQSHHSNTYYINKAFEEADWKKISEAVGKNITSANQIWDLSPEDLMKLQAMPDIWDIIYNGGFYDKQEYIDQYLDLVDVIEELEEELRESLTQITFDSLYNEFIDTLMDMEASSEDFADRLSEIFMKAMLANEVGRLYSDKLEQWYKDFAKAMEDGMLGDDEINSLRNEYNSIVNDAINTRNQIAAAIGYDGTTTSDQEATYGRSVTMSEDTGNELNGRATALQMAGEEIKRESIAQTIAITEIKGSLNNYLPLLGYVKTGLDNVLNFVSLSYIELQQINENTANNVTELKKVAKLIAKWDTKIMAL